LKRVWFPLLYLAFLIPPPDGVIVPLTRALKLGVASSAVELLSLLGFRVAFNGAQLYIDNYELVVAAACSGLNSLSSLLAIGLLYIYLRHEASWRYALLLSLLVIPVAIVTNVVRVMVLLLVTHYLGEDAAQGMLHEAAGLLMFFVALFALIGIDALLMPIYKRLNRPAVLL
jgi:exosortase